MRSLKVVRLALIAGATALMFGLGSSDVSAQDRGNKGGEMRGKDRAGQVKEMNDQMQKKEKKAKKFKKDKMGKKGKK